MDPGSSLTVNEPRGRRLRPSRRRLIRWSLIGLAALALLLGAGVATAWVLFRLRGPELIRAELEGALVTALGRPTRVDAVTFRPWPVALRVSGVAIASGASWEQGTLLRLDHGDVSVRLESLWRRRLVIGVTLTGIEVTATAEGGGGLALPVLPDTVAIGPVTARLAVVQIREGRILYRDPDAPWTVEVRGLDADGRPQPDALTLSATAESLRLESPAARERVERVRAEGTIRAGEVSVRSVRFRWEGHEAELSGQLRPTPAGLALRGTVRGEASLVPIASRAGMTWPLTGIARFDATLEGPAAAPWIEGRVTVPELAAGSFRARGVHLEGSFGDGTLHLRHIQGDLPGGRVRGAFTLSPDPGAGARRAHLALDGLRAPGVLASLGPASVQAEGRLEGGGIELGPVTARWAAARLDVSGRVEPGGRLGLRADLDADLGPLARAMGATGVAGPAHVTAETTGTWDRPVVAGQADVGPLTLTTRTVDRVELRYRLASSESFSRWTGTLEAPRVAPPRGADRGPPGGRRARRRAGRGPAPHRPRPWRPADAARDLGLGGQRIGGGRLRPGRARQAARASRRPLARRGPVRPTSEPAHSSGRCPPPRRSASATSRSAASLRVGPPRRRCDGPRPDGGARVPRDAGSRPRATAVSRRAGPSPRRPDSSGPTWIPSWHRWRLACAGECSGASRHARRPRFPWGRWKGLG